MIFADLFPAPKVAFESVDTNESGFISYYDFSQFLKATYPGKAMKLAKVLIQKLLYNWDNIQTSAKNG